MRAGEPLILWDWTFNHVPEIWQRVQEHLLLTGIAVSVGFVLAFALSLAIRQAPILYGPVTWVTGILYTIPSLALFAFLVPLMGIGQGPVIVGLVLYSLLILVRNTVVGLRGVPGPVMEAAAGMGLTDRQRLLRVELPLALPAIVAGIRIATVSAVGIATIGVLVGGGGLGELIYVDGIQRDLFLTPIVAGAVCATALAIALDLLLLAAERVLAPWTRRAAAR
jgi:osmoprotectant transport system permease protein